MTYLEKCLKSLGKDATVISDRETKDKIFEGMFSTFDFLHNGLNKSADGVVKMDLEIVNEFLTKSSKCIILWDEYDLPVLQSNTLAVVQSLEDILIVSFDTWVLDLDSKWILEFNHEGFILQATKA